MRGLTRGHDGVAADGCDAERKEPAFGALYLAPMVLIPHPCPARYGFQDKTAWLRWKERERQKDVPFAPAYRKNFEVGNNARSVSVDTAATEVDGDQADTSFENERGLREADNGVLSANAMTRDRRAITNMDERRIRARSLLAEAIQQLARKDPIQDRADLCLIRAEIRRIIDPDSPEILAPAENKNNYNSSKLLTHTPKRGGQLDAEVGLQVKPKTRGTRAREYGGPIGRRAREKVREQAARQALRREMERSARNEKEQRYWAAVTEQHQLHLYRPTLEDHNKNCAAVLYPGANAVEREEDDESGMSEQDLQYEGELVATNRCTSRYWEEAETAYRQERDRNETSKSKKAMAGKSGKEREQRGVERHDYLVKSSERHKLRIK